jgi:hypothetical protein
MLPKFKILTAAFLALGLSSAAVNAQYNPAANTEIPVGAIMNPGASYTSTDGRFTLIFQAFDRNLVLYQGSKALWSAKTNKSGCTNPPGAPACTAPQSTYITFQADGNFVVYDQFNRGYNISNTDGNPNSHLSLQNDGNLVIYNSSNKAIWSTKSCCH